MNYVNPALGLTSPELLKQFEHPAIITGSTTHPHTTKQGEKQENHCKNFVITTPAGLLSFH